MDIDDLFRQTPSLPNGMAVEPLLDGVDALEQTCRRLEAMVHEGGWDQRPQYYTLIIVGDKAAVVDTENAMKGPGPLLGGLAVADIRLPDFCYGNPAEGLDLFLRMLAGMGDTGGTILGELGITEADRQEHGLNPKALLKLLNSLVPVGFYGFGAMSEGWKLPDSMSYEEQMAYRQFHQISDHPDCIELRNLVVATGDGRVGVLVRARNEFPIYTELDPTEHSFGGRVPDCVRMVTDMFDRFATWREAAHREFEAHHGGSN